MEQLNITCTDNGVGAVAKSYYDEIVSLLEKSPLGYDLSKVKIEHREPELSDAYDTILIFKYPCFHIKGKRKKYLYLKPSFAKCLEKISYSFEAGTSARWPRIALESFGGFSELATQIEELYEECLRESDPFGCCGSYIACSDAGQCIKTDIMFAGKCTYRQNLKAGRIFYGKNKNI